MTLRDQLGGLKVELAIDLSGMNLDDEQPSTKAEANYRRSTNDRSCGECSHFLSSPDYTAPGRCSLVSGAIDPSWVCDFYDRAGSGDGGSEADGAEA